MGEPIVRTPVVVEDAANPIELAPPAPDERSTLDAPPRVEGAGLTRPTVLPPEGASAYEAFGAREPEHVARYTFERRIEIVLGILHALEHAHATGILHRDLKPENGMIGKHGEVQLMDWGIALPFRAGARPSIGEPRGAVTGTPWFMSPEQARGEADTLDARSDLYAVGALFHELLLLRHYLGEERDPARVVERVGTEGWTQSLLDWHRGPGPMPPMELYHFVRRTMAFDRARRWSSAGEMIGELHRVLDGRVRVQCPITLVKSTTRHAGRFVDRWPWLSFFAYAGTAALAGWGALHLAGLVG